MNGDKGSGALSIHKISLNYLSKIQNNNSVNVQCAQEISGRDCK